MMYINRGSPENIALVKGDIDTIAPYLEMPDYLLEMEGYNLIDYVTSDYVDKFSERYIFQFIIESELSHMTDAFDPQSYLYYFYFPEYNNCEGVGDILKELPANAYPLFQHPLFQKKDSPNT